MVTQKQMFVSEELKKKKKKKPKTKTKQQQQQNKQNNTKKCKNSYEIYPEPIIDK